MIVIVNTPNTTKNNATRFNILIDFFLLIAVSFSFFTSYNDGAKSGTYSLTDATSAAGTFTQSLAGVDSTETIIAQSDWNEDTLDGGGGGDNPSGITLDPTKGNVYEIKYQWLGFGEVEFSVEHNEDGKYHLVHRIKYANENTLPSVDNPTLPLYATAENTTNTSDIVLQIGSMGGFIEGREVLKGIPKSLSVATADIDLVELPIMTIHNHDIYQGTINRVRVKPTVGSVSIDGTKPAIVRIRKNATLVAASFSSLDSNTSTIHIDTSATSVSGGEIIFTESVAKEGSVEIDLEKLGIDLIQPDFLTLSIQGTAINTAAVSTLNWQELF